jgi:hypothetical protein
MSDEFDGCRRDCRTVGIHTLVWGDCEQGVEPPPPAPVVPVVSLSDDGCMSIGYEPYDLAGHDAEVRAGVFAEVRAELVGILNMFMILDSDNAKTIVLAVDAFTESIAPEYVTSPPMADTAGLRVRAMVAVADRMAQHPNEISDLLHPHAHATGDVVDVVLAEVRAELLAIAEEFAAERPGRSSYDATGARYLADLVAPKPVEEPS